MKDLHELEARLQRDLRTAADDLRGSGDAWQQNQRRLAADAARRRTRVLQFGGGTLAAALVAVVVLVALPTERGDEGHLPATSPAPSGPLQDPWFQGDPIDEKAPVFHGDPVDEKALSENRQVSLFVTMFVSTESVNVCDGSLVGAGSQMSVGSSGCAVVSADAKDVDVAFDYLAGREWGADTPPGKSVAGLVDERVTSVEVTFLDGSSRLLYLHERPGGYRAFGLLVGSGDVPPQRLVALGDDRATLEDVDLLERFPGLREANAVPEDFRFAEELRERLGRTQFLHVEWHTGTCEVKPIPLDRERIGAVQVVPDGLSLQLALYPDAKTAQSVAAELRKQLTRCYTAPGRSIETVSTSSGQEQVFLNFDQRNADGAVAGWAVVHRGNAVWVTEFAPYPQDNQTVESQRVRVTSWIRDSIDKNVPRVCAVAEGCS